MPGTEFSVPGNLSVQQYFFIFVTSLFFSMLFTPVVGALAIRIGAMDSPSGRKLHRKPIPLMGGLAVFVALWISVYILIVAGNSFRGILAGAAGKGYLLEGILAGGLVILAIGIIDDIKGVDPTTKLLGQVIAALILVQYGIKIEGVAAPFSGRFIQFPVYLTIFVSVLWVVGFVNSINLIDGVDGLSSGVTAIASFVFFLILLLQLRSAPPPEVAGRMQVAAVLSLAICGASTGFLKFNFPPGKIFLGDSGSLFLGYMAGAITITGMLKTAAALTVAIPVIIFAVPLIDTVFSFVRRIFRKKSFMEPDRDHIHHRLLYRRGWNEKRVVLTIYGITALLGLTAVVITILR